ncbi:MAG TPA: phosphoribosyltransferase family protein [Opitutaceae bacterium]|nr:phosphoribosyltransferase family protein [Opitutaceae bacterium]
MPAAHPYRDRAAAGRVLAQHLAHHRERPGVVVLGLPRGGVPVALEVARFLGAPLDIFLVRKLGLPGEEEFALGAIASGGVRLLDDALVAAVHLPPDEIERIVRRETAELRRRENLYRANRPELALTGRHLIVVDDGFATGFSMRAALAALRRLQPAWLTAAAPVGAPETCAALADACDEVVCPLRPSSFRAVGLWYERFEPTSDAGVQAALREGASLSTPKK